MGVTFYLTTSKVEVRIGGKPYLGEMTISEAINLAENGFESKFGTAQAEGIVLRAPCGILDRRGERIIAKIKSRDFPATEGPGGV